MKTTWISAHLYYTGPLDEVLNDAVTPFLDRFGGLLTQPAPFFFIRYPQGGDHIRLRLHTTQPALIRQILMATFPDLKFIHYAPEITRYGDHSSIAWAEAHFFLSSRIILDWVRTRSPQASPQIKAIELHLQLLAATQWSIPQLTSLCSYFIDDWLTIFKTPPTWFLDTFQKALAPQCSTLFPLLAEHWLHIHQHAYYTDHIPIMQAYNTAGFTPAQLTGIFTSMLHMTHNRIGIQNWEEAYILYCLRAFFTYLNTRHEQ